MEKDLKLNELLNNMDKRLSILEAVFLIKKNKKGMEFDPRILMIIILLILLYLFLKSAGYLP